VPRKAIVFRRGGEDAPREAAAAMAVPAWRKDRRETEVRVMGGLLRGGGGM
jgi:hypothetical protein